MTRAFTSLNPQEALHAAILIEERNAGIYHRLAEMFTEFGDTESLEMARVFWDMAVEEKRHSSMLQVHYQEQYGASRCNFTEEDLRDMIEVPRLDDGDVFAVSTTSQLKARERAIQVAVAAEQRAHDFYGRLAEMTQEGPLHRLYIELASMEDGHVSYLENLMSTSVASEDTGIN